MCHFVEIFSHTIYMVKIKGYLHWCAVRCAYEIAIDFNQRIIS